MNRKEGAAITESFSQLDSKKQQRIINAALAEFAEHGYEQASTNRIVQAAGIGKGMLFYYFQSKQSLYEFLVAYSLDVIVRKYLNHVDEHELDLIERYKQAARIKMDVFAEHPSVFHFLGNIFLNKEATLSADVQQRLDEVRQIGFTKLYANFNECLFRDDLDQEMIFKLIQWTLDGYEKDILRRIEGKNVAKVDFAPFWDEFDDVLETLRVLFYKNA